MATLTKVSYDSRRIIKYGGGGLVLFVVLWSVLVGAIKAYRLANPSTIPPTMRYGLLPKIDFPTKEFERKSFVAELANDSFPKFDDQAKIYVIYRPSSDFLALEYDKQVAAGLGFGGEPKTIRYGVYEFRNDNLNQTLTMNVFDGSFVLKYPYLEDQTLLVPGKVPSKNEAIVIASDYLEAGGKLSPELESGKKEISFWKIEGSGLATAPNREEANVVRVDLFRDKIDKLPVLGIQQERSPVSILVAGSGVDSKKIVEVNYKTMAIDQESHSTYPLKSVEVAWTEMQAGNYWPSSDSDQVSIRITNVFLAYFEPVTLTNFLQPVFVFEGDGNFVAYVPAVDASAVSQ